ENLDLAWDYAHGGDLSKALALLAQWEQASPQEAEYPFTAGSLLYQEGRLEESLRGFTRALELHPTGTTALWARLYAADILLTQHRTAHAQKLLDEALRLEGSPRSIRFAANLKLRIRIRGELSEVNEFGDFIFYLPPYLIPVAERQALYKQVEADWAQAASFLGLKATAPRPIIYLYPSGRLYEKYFPAEVDLVEASYAHREVHLVFGGADPLQVLAPYGLHLLQQEINRGGRSYYLVPPALDEAIRGTTPAGVGLGAFCRAAWAEGKLPPVESLADPRNQGRIPPAVAEPATGLLLRFLKDRLGAAAFRGLLVHPDFLVSLPRPVSSYQADFERYVVDEADLLEDPAAVAEGVEAIPPYAALPIIPAGLETELVEATKLYEAGDKAAALALVDRILAREPRYGEARYLLAKELYDAGDLKAAKAELERVLQDTAPNSRALGFSHFYLGRIAKLANNYPLSSFHYGAALAAGLPADRAVEAQAFKAAIDHFQALGPAED
ncbi:MAG TPA: tetratricopeptide repeat protein, partial [bacterium]|nr:tetratricopeptide repeat protein [bacterium]